MKKILVVNGSLGGTNGNTAKFLDVATELLSKRVAVENYCLGKTGKSRAALILSLDASDGMLIGSGNYWSNYSSFIQAFIEEISELEGTSSLLGKPVAFLLSQHSVGGSDVIARLSNIFNNLGCMIPPQASVVMSLTNQLALQCDPNQMDVWAPADLEVLVHNLVEAVEGTNKWKSFDVDRTHVNDLWVKLPAKKDPPTPQPDKDTPAT